MERIEDSLQGLDALRAEFVRSAPPGRAGLQAAKPVRAARLPRRTAPGRSGSGDVLSRRLVSLLQLRAYQQVLGEITRLGA
jgi:hypothetical protein